MGEMPKLCAESRMAWALLPPIPNELTLMRSRRASGHGIGSVGTDKPHDSQGISGFGVLNLMLGGMVRLSNAMTALMRDERPEAPSEWPRLGLTDPIWIPPEGPNTRPT